MKRKYANWPSHAHKMVITASKGGNMLIDCYSLRDCGIQSCWGGRYMTQPGPPPGRFGHSTPASRFPPSPLSPPGCPGLARDADKPRMVASQPSRATQGSGNQDQLRLVLSALAAAEVWWGHCPPLIARLPPAPEGSWIVRVGRPGWGTPPPVHEFLFTGLLLRI